MKRIFWNLSLIFSGLNRRFLVPALLSALMLSARLEASDVLPASSTLCLEFQPVWGERALNLAAEQGTDASGATVSISRLDFVLSGVALQLEDGRWQEFRDSLATVRFEQGKGTALITGVPLRKFTAIRFSVGLESRESIASGVVALQNPSVSESLADFMRPEGDLSILSLEGKYQKRDGTFGVFGYHLACPRDGIRVELPLTVAATQARIVRLAFDVEKIFRGNQPIRIASDGDSTSRPESRELEAKLRANVEAAFRVKSTVSDRQTNLAARETDAFPDGQPSLWRELPVYTPAIPL